MNAEPVTEQATLTGGCVCLHCGAVFCPDNRLAEPGMPFTRQLYCDSRCADNAAKKRKRPARQREMRAQKRASWPICAVCSTRYQPVGPGQRYDSPACRQFAFQHAGLSPELIGQLWRRQQAEVALPCPSGKVRHPDRESAEKAARAQTYLHYQGMRSWLSVYECPDCYGWHLTSKPQQRRRRP